MTPAIRPATTHPTNPLTRRALASALALATLTLLALSLLAADQHFRADDAHARDAASALNLAGATGTQAAARLSTLAAYAQRADQTATPIAAAVTAARSTANALRVAATAYAHAQATTNGNRNATAQAQAATVKAQSTAFAQTVQDLRDDLLLAQINLARAKGDDAQALLLAFEALHTDHAASAAKAAEFEGVLRTLLAAHLPNAQPYAFGGTHEWDSLTLSADNRWLATSNPDGVFLWALADLARDPYAAPRQLASVPGSPLAFSSDGRWLAAGGNPGYLWALTTNPATQITLHQATVMAFSPDSRWIVTAQMPVQMAGTAPRAAGLARPPAQASTGIELWELAALTRDAHSAPKLLNYGAGGVFYITFSPDGHWLAVTDYTGARLWDLHSADPATTLVLLSENRFEDYGVTFSPDGRWLAATEEDGMQVRVWDMRAANFELAPRTFAGARRPLFSSDGRWLAMTTTAGTQVWPSTAFTGEATPRLLANGGEALAFSHNSRRLVTVNRATYDLQLWDLSTPDSAALQLASAWLNQWITVATFSADDRWLITSTGAMMIGCGGPMAPPEGTDLWDLTSAPIGASMRPRAHLRLSTMYKPTFTFTPDQHWLAVQAEGYGSLWDLTTLPTPTNTGAPEAAGARSPLALSPDGAWLIAGGTAPLHAWHIAPDGTSTDFTLTLPDAPESVSALAISQISAENLTTQYTLIAGYPDGRVLTWPLAVKRAQLVAMQAPQALAGHTSALYTIATHTERELTGLHQWIATGDASGHLQVWDLNALTPLVASFNAHTGAVRALAFDEDGHDLASGGDDGTAYLWSLDTLATSTPPRAYATLPEHIGAVTTIAFERWNAGVIIGDASGAVRRWTPYKDHNAFSKVLYQGTQAITVLAQVTNWDMAWLITGDASGDLRFWATGWESDERTTQPYFVLHTPGDPATLVAGHGTARIFTAYASGTFTSRDLWSVHPIVRSDWFTDLTAPVCFVAGRELTPAEWSTAFPNEAYRATCTQAPNTP